MAASSDTQGKSKEVVFWEWFIKNTDILFHFEADQDRVFESLSAAIKKVNPDLTFEFGPITQGKREFVISAGGIRASFHAVESLYSEKPDLDQWIFIKFRPRRNIDQSIRIGNTLIKPEEVKYLFFKDKDPRRIALLLFIRGFNDKNADMFRQIGYLFLDGTIGEYDVETYIGAIDIQGFNSGFYKKSFPLKNMALTFDAWKESNASSGV